MRGMVGQLMRDGTIGEMGSFEFVSADTIVDRLMADGSKMMLTVGLSFRNPAIFERVFDTDDAMSYILRCGDFYNYEACYTGDGYLHVTALTDNDLC